MLFGRSIRSKLPLAVVGLILLVGVSISTAAYVVIQRTLHQSAGDRLKSLSAQFTESFRASVAAAQARAAQAARRPELAAYLANPQASLAPATIAALAPNGPNPELSLFAELRDANGRVLLSTDSALGNGHSADVGWEEMAKLTPPLDPAVPTSGVTYSKLHQQDDSMQYAVVARIPGDHPGYYVNWRVVSRTSQARTQIAGMLGSEAALYFANSDGTGWSDLGRPVPAPSEAVPASGLVEYRGRKPDPCSRRPHWCPVHRGCSRLSSHSARFKHRRAHS